MQQPPGPPHGAPPPGHPQPAQGWPQQQQAPQQGWPQQQQAPQQGWPQQQAPQQGWPQQQAPQQGWPQQQQAPQQGWPQQQAPYAQAPVVAGPAAPLKLFSGSPTCPHCGAPMGSHSQGSSMGFYAGGLVGWLLIRALATKHYCPTHGEVPKAALLPEHQRTLNMRMGLMIGGAVLLLALLFIGYGSYSYSYRY